MSKPTWKSWSTVMLWLALLTPSMCVSMWLALWLQWYVPGEDLWGVEYVMAAALIAGLVLGIGWSVSPWWGKGMWLAFAAGSLPREFWLALLGPPLMAIQFLLFILSIWAVLLIVPFLAGALVSRRSKGAWKTPLLASLALVLLTLEVFCGLSNHKSFWPWKGHQQELIDLRHNATAAARRIGLSTDGLDPGAIALLEREVPLKTSFDIPFIGRRIIASVRDGGSDVVWIYFGDGRFGPLNPTTMYIAWVDD